MEVFGFVEDVCALPKNTCGLFGGGRVKRLAHSILGEAVVDICMAALACVHSYIPR